MTNYKTVVRMKDIGVFHTLYESVKALLHEIKELLRTEQLTIQLLETTCWIEYNGVRVMSFYEARDYAVTAGWLKNGKWVGSIFWEQNAN